jgi:hypothetical protein
MISGELEGIVLKDRASTYREEVALAASESDPCLA